MFKLEMFGVKPTRWDMRNEYYIRGCLGLIEGGIRLKRGKMMG